MSPRAVLLLALAGAACGGRALGKDAGPGGDARPDGTSPDASQDASPDAAVDAFPDAAWSPVCPEMAPVVGEACSASAGMVPVHCEYGTVQFDPQCDIVFECSGAKWVPVFPGGSCNPDGPNLAGCPPSYHALIPDGTCSPAGLRCEYPEALCTCSGPIGGPIEIDASTSWHCDPGPGCPMPRPRLGASCSGPATVCTYLDCDFGETCRDGFWQAVFEGCAK